jgi:2-hydroxychromene-2-carboxylate isomerase
MDLEFWFDFASTYSYLSLMRIDALVHGTEVRIVWRPFLLGPVFHAFGWSTSPFLLQKEKGIYMWRDMERQCRKFGLPWHRPGEFPQHSVLAARVALIGIDQPWFMPFAQQVMLANFDRGQNIGSEAVIRDILDRLSLPGEALIGAAQADANKSELRKNTDLALRRGIFGAPTFFVGDQMYWGNDRLDDAVDQARGATR